MGWSSGKRPGDGVLARVAGSTYSTIQDMQNIFHSAGWVTGGGITNQADGTILVAAGTGFIRANDTDVAEILFTDWPANESGGAGGVDLADNDTSYVYVEWNSGTPRAVASTSAPTDFNTKILLAIISRIGTELHINAAEKHVVGDHASRMIRRLKEVEATSYGRVSGAALAATGTQNFSISAASWWHGLTEFNTAVFDSNPGGAGDTFGYWYRKVSDSGWNEVTGVSDIHNTNYDNNSGGLATLTSANKYGVHWIYIEVDDDVHVVYGQGDYTLTQAIDAQPPGGLPEPIAAHGILVGKIIIQKNGTTFTEILSASETVFTGSLAAAHGDLVGLTDNDHPQYLLSELDRETEQFVAALHSIGELRRLWVPALTGTDVTDKSRNAATITYLKEVGDFDTPPAALGYGNIVTFNGTDEEADMPDADDVSFGDGASNEPLSVIALVKQDVAEAAVILAKEASSSDEEWVLETDSSGNPQFILTDESASATIGKRDATPLSTSSWSLISGTYDGNALASGIKIYLNGISTGDTNVATNAFVAMEAGASKVQVAHHYATPALFWDGSIAFIAIYAKELNADDQWYLKQLVNSFFDLNL